MLKLNKDQQVLPDGGHHFSTRGIMFRADSFEELLEKVADFRIANMILPGDLNEEILQYYAECFPQMVLSDGKPYKPKIDGTYEQWARWMGMAWRSPVKANVAPKEAEMRTDICKTCPRNKPMNFQESPGLSSLKQRSYILTRGYGNTDKINFCDLHRADISVLSFSSTPDALSEKESSAEPQACCWVGSLKGS